MRRLIIAAAVLLALCVGLARADVPDPDIFRRRPLPKYIPEVKATASMKVEPAKGQKNMLRLSLTMTGAGRYEYVVREKADGHTVCSGDGTSEGNGKVVEVLFPHREISGNEEARYIAEATFTPLNVNGAVQVIRQVLVVCLIDGSVTVMEELDVPEIL